MRDPRKGLRKLRGASLPLSGEAMSQHRDTWPRLLQLFSCEFKARRGTVRRFLGGVGEAEELARAWPGGCSAPGKQHAPVAHLETRAEARHGERVCTVHWIGMAGKLSGNQNARLARPFAAAFLALRSADPLRPAQLRPSVQPNRRIGPSQSGRARRQGRRSGCECGALLAPLVWQVGFALCCWVTRGVPWHEWTPRCPTAIPT